MRALVGRCGGGVGRDGVAYDGIEGEVEAEEGGAEEVFEDCLCARGGEVEEVGEGEGEGAGGGGGGEFCEEGVGGCEDAREDGEVDPPGDWGGGHGAGEMVGWWGGAADGGCAR